MIAKALNAQRLGNSGEAHKYMRLAYAQARTAEEAARLFSHQLLLHWSFGSEQAITTDLETYYHTHVKHVERFYTQQKLILNTPRPLRIGYLSPDLRSCSAARLISDVFQYSPKNTQSVVYDAGIADATDPVHQRLYTYMVTQRNSHWKKVAPFTSRQLANTIYEDKIDILIDLAGHTSMSQLKTLAYQPAPLQVSGLTFNGGIGLGDRCLRATDVTCTPHTSYYPHDTPLYLPLWISSTPSLAKNQHEVYQTERIRLLKKTVAGHWNLGCAHHPGRLSAQCLKIWGQLLKTLPYTTLHLKHQAYRHADCKKYILTSLCQAGAKTSQIHFSLESPYLRYLEFYQNLDLALDPFPYHGGLVSCDAFWMGVDLVSESSWMKGGESLLRHLGLSTAWTNESQYIETVIERLENHEQRYELAHTLPQKMSDSLAGTPSHWVSTLFSALETYIKIV